MTHRFSMPHLDRRSFLVNISALGGALVLGFDIPFRAGPARAAENREITAWVVIAPDDWVTVRVARSEMGQGSFTALPMLVAEELECDWSRVRAELVAPEENLRRDRVWGHMSTGGSRAIRDSQAYLRLAGATAREMLIAAAAARWGVAPSECSAALSVITHAPTGRSLRFGEVAEQAANIPPPADLKLKDPSEWKLIGTSQNRLEIGDKVLGKPIYGIDVRVPGMLHAAIVQCPVFTGSPRTIDDAAARTVKGVRQVVRLPDAVAVVAESFWQAKKAADALKITWDAGENTTVSSETIKGLLREGLIAADAVAGRRNGDLEAGLAAAATRVEAEYYVPFLSHATLEPQNCTAHVTPEKVEIWVPTQNGMASLEAAAHAAHMSTDKVVVHRTMVGGAFGRRGATQDYVRQAVAIAKQVGRPVKLVWTREEDMQHDFYRPAVMARLTAGLDGSGMPIAWHARLSGPSVIASLMPSRLKNGQDHELMSGFTEEMVYRVPNYLADCVMRNTHVPVGFWRSVNHSQNTFFRESFVDEMAYAAGVDPYQYRRKLLSRNPKHLAVLDAVARRAGWGAALPEGVGRGIAIQRSYMSIVAQVVEASIGSQREVNVHRVFAAIDPGHAVNPRTIEMQIEGAIVYALTAALYGEITIRDGRVEQSNFHDYEMLRVAQMPTVETVIVPSGASWGGVGEPATPPLAPALCNAIFAATGKRVRALPLKSQDLKQA
jgi:isoquinoline 1-oxidoreductase subunit beta